MDFAIMFVAGMAYGLVGLRVGTVVHRQAGRDSQDISIISFIMMGAIWPIMILIWGVVIAVPIIFGSGRKGTI